MRDTLLNNKKALVVYWLLLIYVVIAVAWSFVLLNRQSETIFAVQVKDIGVHSPAYARALADREMRYYKHLGEIGVSLFIILFGAGILFRLLRRMIYIAHQERNFLLAISHELKTPLASIHLNLETILRPKLRDEDRDKLTRRALAESKRLDILFNNVLMSAQLSGGKVLRHAFESIVVRDLLDEVLRQFRHTFREQMFILEAPKHAPAVLYGHKNLIHLLFYNLIDNAIKYNTPDKAPITLRIHCDEKFIYIDVADLGVGISEADKRFVFRKFFRVGDEKTRATKGTGLGLYIVRETVRLHKGKIKILDNKPQGTIFNIRFPLR